jgi:hypothetical protein
MNLARKIEMAAQTIRSISRHEDEDAAVRQAVLDQVEATIKDERAWITARIAERIAASLQSS